MIAPSTEVYVHPKKSTPDIHALAAGKRLYRAVDVEAYAAQGAEPDDRWLWLAAVSVVSA